MRYEVQMLPYNNKIAAAADREEDTGKNPMHPVEYVVIDTEAPHPRERVVCYARHEAALRIARELNLEVRS